MRNARCISFFCFFVLVINFTLLSEAGEPVDFVITAEEQAYLNSLRNRTISIAYSYDLIDVEFEGESSGILKPILDVLKDKFGLSVELQMTDWHNAFNLIDSGKIDFYGPIAISDGRQKKYITVIPFYRNDAKIITRKDEPVNSMFGLYNRSIGLLDDSVMSRTMQSYIGPKGDIVYFSGMDDMISALRDGRVDAFATVDNAEYEILSYDDIQFEFSIDNYYVEQGLISSKEEMRPLAELLSRYINENSDVKNEIIEVRRAALLQFIRERFSEEIAYLREKHNEIPIFAEPILYPLCYDDDGIIKGMQSEINDMFTELTGIPVSIYTNNDFQDGVVSAIELVTSGTCLAAVGVYYNVDLWTNPSIDFSPMLWRDTIRTYSRNDVKNELSGKRLGTTPFAADYLGWNNTTGNTPIINGSRQNLITELLKDEIDAIYISEMTFNYEYSIRKDYRLHEVEGLSADAVMHMMYGAQNPEFNMLYNEAMNLCII